MADEVRGLRRGGMAGAEQEVEGTLVRESEIKETPQEEKDEEGKQKWKTEEGNSATTAEEV